MTDQPDRHPEWLMFVGLARSFAHAAGNLVNVVSGRLSLLQLQASLDADATASLNIARDRLLATQQSMQQMMQFLPNAPSTGSVSDCLRRLRNDCNLSLEGLDGSIDACSHADHGGLGWELPLRTLQEAHKVLHNGGQTWSVFANEQDDTFNVTLELDSRYVPPGRRELIEPWFSEAAIALAPDIRHARMCLAVALAAIEMAGGTFRSESVAEGNTETQTATRLQLRWPLKRLATANE